MMENMKVEAIKKKEYDIDGDSDFERYSETNSKHNNN